MRIDADKLERQAARLIKEGGSTPAHLTPEGLLSIALYIRDLQDALKWSLDLLDDELAKYGKSAEADRAALVRTMLL